MASARRVIDACVARQKVPALFRARPVVLLQIGRLLRARQLGRFVGVDAECDHVEILAGAERHRLQATGQPVQKLVTEQRTAIIDRRQDHGPSTEQLGQPQLASRFVAKSEVERELHSQLLVEPDLADHAAHGCLRGRRRGVSTQQHPRLTTNTRSNLRL